MTTYASPLAVVSFARWELRDSAATFVYIARDQEGHVLYVGITGSLHARFHSHREADRWWSKAASFTLELWPDRASAASREEELILHIDPPYNTGPGGLRLRDRTARDNRFIELYQRGVTFEAMAKELGITTTSLHAKARKLRSAGRIGHRPRVRRGESS